ncbi:hypothetical protein TruAng_008056 [Truncatella angustata]|nr:hypothetical protein TruAng_008056 [Truncatella angustata]
MASTKSKILVLGGTGPAGLCLLRELAYRNHATIVYARTPSKIPPELASSPLIEILQGELQDRLTLSTAVADCSTIISLLGPNINDKNIDPNIFAEFYITCLFPLMREYRVRRIFAMGTLSIKRDMDSWTIGSAVAVAFVRLFASGVFQTMQNIANAFDKQAHDIDWTVFRITSIPGGSDEASWKIDRNDGKPFTGWIGDKGWTFSQKRAALTKWLVDAVEDGEADWIGL